MKVATFNINNVNRRLPNLLSWLRKGKPDVVCLQELKADDASFPMRELANAGYHAVWHGQKTWNGVAILSKEKPVLTRKGLPGDTKASQSRYIEAAVSGILVGCIYLPNGNPQPGPKFDYKLEWMDKLIRHSRKLGKSGAPVILAGDFNVVPDLALDIYKTKSWDDDALTQPEPRKRFAKLLSEGWTDALRELNPETVMYTYYDYKRLRWKRKAGLRIDHLLLSSLLRKRLKACGVDTWTRGEDGASDHVPAWIQIR